MHGRPSRDDSLERAQLFMRLCAEGVRFDVAAASARVKPQRALRLLSDPAARASLLLQEACPDSRAAEAA